jgi:hypothetical protein
MILVYFSRFVKVSAGAADSTLLSTGSRIRPDCSFFAVFVSFLSVFENQIAKEIFPWYDDPNAKGAAPCTTDTAA